MIEMSPFYAHDSAVGPVFDVATWSRGKAWSMAVFAFLFGALVATALVFAWKPTLLLEKPPEFIASFHQETLKLQKEHPWAALGGTAFVALVGLLALAGSCASVLDALTGDYHFRAGPGGISLRVPHGLDLSKFGLVFKKLELELPMEQIHQWTIVQHKQLGSMSRSAGNIMAFLKIRTVDGKREEFNLDCFREPSHVIQSKINDALEMVPAQFGPPPDGLPGGLPDGLPGGGVSSRPCRTVEEKCEAILGALAGLLDLPDVGASVVLSDAEGGKCVQFAGGNHALLLDLPRQALDESEYARAGEYFARLRDRPRDQYATQSSDGTTMVAEDGFQVNVTDIDQAARLALEVFNEVYQLPSDFPLVVEQV